MSPPASSSLQAETFGLMLATRLADILNVQDSHFTDCSVLALAAKATDIRFAPGPWDNGREHAGVGLGPPAPISGLTGEIWAPGKILHGAADLDVELIGR